MAGAKRLEGRDGAPVKRPGGRDGAPVKRPARRRPPKAKAEAADAPPVAATPSSNQATVANVRPAERAPKGRSFNRTAMIAVMIGVLAVAITAAAYFLAPRLLRPRGPTAGQPSRASCSLAPELTFNAPPGTQTTTFSLDPSRACLNGRTPYEKTAKGYSRVITNAAASVVTTLDISADQTSFQRRDYVLSPTEFAALRAAIGSTRSLACSPLDTPATVAAHQSRLAAIRAASTPYLARRATAQITWRCSPAG